MTDAVPGLVAGLVDLAETGYGVDWDSVRSAVGRRLDLAPHAVADVIGPSRNPSYWCVPVLVGGYVTADREDVLEDLVSYVSACLVRHFFHEDPAPFTLPVDDVLASLVGRAYSGCRPGRGPFEEHFAAKCETWTVVLAFGTQAIRERATDPEAVGAALGAIVAVYSCTQLLDDWHDRADDRGRGHWNAWTDAPLAVVTSAAAALLEDADRRVGELRHHPLRDALTSQLNDTARELADVVLTTGASPNPTRDAAVDSGVRWLHERLGEHAPGLWRDFALPGVSVGSTECISAFAATLIAPVPTARPIARTVASTLLAHARPSGGWGYREDVVEDADSTAWVMLASAATHVTTTPGLLARSQAYLVAHRGKDGGFSTYSPSERDLLTPGDVPRWSDTDAAVTSSAVLALARTGYPDPRISRSGCDFVAGHATETGWPSLWWRGTAYGTWLAVWALTEVGGARYRAELSRARQHLLATRRADGTWGEGGSRVFDTALAVRTLTLLGQREDAEVIRASAAALASGQRPSGRWPGAARMLAPGVDGGRDVVLGDELVTTVCAVSALHHAGAAGVDEDPA